MQAGELGKYPQTGILVWILWMKRCVINFNVFQEARICEEKISFMHLLMRHIVKFLGAESDLPHH